VTRRGLITILLICVVISIGVNLRVRDRCDSMVATALASGTHIPDNALRVTYASSGYGYGYALHCTDGTYTAVAFVNGVGKAQDGCANLDTAGSAIDSMLGGVDRQ